MTLLLVDKRPPRRRFASHRGAAPAAVGGDIARPVRRAAAIAQAFAQTTTGGATSPSGGLGAQLNLMSGEAINAGGTAFGMACYLAAAVCFGLGVWALWQSRQPQNRETGYVGRGIAGLVLCGLFATAGVWIGKASMTASGNAATINDTSGHGALRRHRQLTLTCARQHGQSLPRCWQAAPLRSAFHVPHIPAPDNQQSAPVSVVSRGNGSLAASPPGVALARFRSPSLTPARVSCCGSARCASLDVLARPYRSVAAFLVAAAPADALAAARLHRCSGSTRASGDPGLRDRHLASRPGDRDRWLLG